MNTIRESNYGCYKGTKVRFGNGKRDIINKMIDVLLNENFVELEMPIIQYSSHFDQKVGEENNNLMYKFKDRGNRDLCLAPEYTSVVQNLGKSIFKNGPYKIFYVAECFRGEKPQNGRYRQFTQIGVEIINANPYTYGSNNWKQKTMFDTGYLTGLATNMLLKCYESLSEFIFSDVGAERGLDFYYPGYGIEVHLADGGSTSQILGGGAYNGGVGFAIGLDRVINDLKQKGRI